MKSLNFIYAIFMLSFFTLGMGAGHAQNAAQNQASIFQMQEQMRQLNGRIEELTFQILELQELLRQTREDNESRFQELEDASEQQGTNTIPSDLVPTENGDNKNDVSVIDDDPEGLFAGDKVVESLDLNNGSSDSSDANIGQPSRILGTLKLDENGQVVDSALGRPFDLKKLNNESSFEDGLQPDFDGPLSSQSSPQSSPLEATDQAAASNGDELASIAVKEDLPAPSDLYLKGYDSVLSGNYPQAEKHFRDLLIAYPQSDRVPNAHYWLGEALFAQGRFNAAADEYLTVINQHPDVPLAPDAMLKLGVALVGMGQRAIACSTFEELGSRYPSTPEYFRLRLKREKTSARCA